MDRWKITHLRGGGELTSTSPIRDFPEIVEVIEVMRVSDYEAELAALREENERLRAALSVAADDLDKAANQFQGLAHLLVIGGKPSNPDIFAVKAERARAALERTAA